VTTTGPLSHTGGVPHFADRLGHDPGGKRLGDRNLVSSREWLVKRSKATRISAAPPRGTPAGTAWLRPRPRVHRPDPGPGRTGREGVYLDEIADRAGIPESETRELLHDLTTVQHLVTELEGSDTPDLGPHYEVRPGL
jgi:hypothetical protein